MVYCTKVLRGKLRPALLDNCASLNLTAVAFADHDKCKQDAANYLSAQLRYFGSNTAPMTRRPFSWTATELPEISSPVFK